VVPRHRGHSLAPDHLGEAGAAAALVSAIGGVAIFIAGAAMTVGGLTLPAKYAGSNPPPNVGQLGFSQLLGGIGLLVLGIVLVGSSTALLGGLPRSRGLAAGVSGLTALLAVAAAVLLVGATRQDLVLLAAVVVTALAFGGSALILARLRR